MDDLLQPRNSPDPARELFVELVTTQATRVAMNAPEFDPRPAQRSADRGGIKRATNTDFTVDRSGPSSPKISVSNASALSRHFVQSTLRTPS